MSNYIGVKCPVCSKRFSSSDDIVVCPVCGAPHHRHCYMEKGECVFAEEHLSGKEWEAPQEAPPPGEEKSSTRNCPSCGANNPAESLFCQVCGTRLGITAQGGNTGQQQGGHNPYGNMGPGSQGQQQGPAAGFPNWSFPSYSVNINSEEFRYGGVSPDSTIGGEKARDVATYVGPNTVYYMPRFRMLSDGASVVSLNFSAAIFSFFYFFYRKMYVVGSILLAISALSMIPYFLYVRELLPELVQDPAFANMLQLMEEWGTTLSLSVADINYDLANMYQRIYTYLWGLKLVIRFVAALFANKLYYMHAIKTVKGVRERSGEVIEPSRYAAVLTSKGGVTTLGAVSSAVICMIGYLAVGTVLFSMVL